MTRTDTIRAPSAGVLARLRRGASVDWENALLAPVDISFLVLFRVVLGLLMAVSMERFLAYGWVDQLLAEPTFRFKYFGFGWVEPLPRDQLITLVRCLVGLGLATAVGFCFRLASVLLALGLSYIQLIDVSTYLNHYYLAALLTWLLALSPAHRSGSVDAWLKRIFKRSSATPHPVTHVPRAWLWLLRFQVGLVYVCAGLAKLQPDWLVHAQPLRIWLGASTELPLLGPVLTWPGVPLIFSWCGFLFDTTIPFFLLWNVSRPYAYVVVLGFHSVTRALFDIGMFPWIMSGAALVFFPPDTPRRLLARLGRAVTGSPPLLKRTAPTPSARLRTRVGLALGLTYAAAQLLIPFRHLAYGGNVLWHEQGMRFSWRVMVRAKGGGVNFLVTNRSTGTSQTVYPREYLNAFQENEMAGQPDLILQLAHHIKEDFQAKGHGPVAVHARAKVSLNGRRAAWLVDPTVDLTQIEDGLGRQSWILPSPTDPPPHIRPVL